MRTRTGGNGAGRLAPALALALACGGGGGGKEDGGVPEGGPSDAAADAIADGSTDAGGGDAGPSGPAHALHDFGADLTDPGHFFDAPYPSDLRLAEDGTPDLTGYPNPNDVELVSDVLSIADDRPGWPVLPVGYFRFSAPVGPRDPSERIAAEPDSPVLLVDVDPDSPDRGALVPTIAVAFMSDAYTGSNLVGVAPWPGFVLHAGRTYAYVLRRSFGDASGESLEVPEAIAALARGEAPAGALGQEARALYTPLWETLDALGVDRGEVAAATVFTTGDVVADLYDLSSRVVDAHDVSVEDVALDPDDGSDHERYCELVARVSMPQFQRGTPPFDEEGLFEIGGDGLPVVQRTEEAALTFAIPKTAMPGAGFPLMVYFHGSGGVAAQVVDRGPAPEGGQPTAGLGPAHVVAEHGFASVGAALPLSPDRLPGASSTEYLNFNNLAAFRDTFRQGVLEQRLLIEALRTLEIPASALGSCTGVEVPAGEPIRFDPGAYVALGQSMGGMYTNLVGAVEPELGALVPTGAGGYWSYFIFETSLIDNIPGLLSLALGTREEALNHLHPTMNAMQTAWEPTEPLVFMPRLSRRPLPELPPRPVYEPVGRGDSFFPTNIYDAVALAYGHQQAGDEVWPSMQTNLALAGREGLASYPVSQNLTSEGGDPYTGVVVQYEGDGFSDPHAIYVQLDEVKYQYGCFLRTYLEMGTPTVPAPAALGTPCPGLP